MRTDRPTVDYDYTNSVVNEKGRKSNFTMFMIMLGFTFF